MSRVLAGCSSLVLSFAMAIGASAQPWTPQTSGTAVLLDEAWFTGPLRGWAVGDAGTSIFTNDGGATWNSIVLTGQDLGDVSFDGVSVGLIVGDNGTVFRTVNGGAAWTPVASGTGSNLHAVAFGAAGFACAAGRDGVILRSTDQGASWSVSETGADRYRDAAAFGSRAWVVGNEGVIRATTDAGATWFSQNSGTVSDLQGVHFVSESEGWAAGQNSTLIHTSDGGNSWAPRSAGILVGLDAVFFVDSSLGWAVGNGGAVFHSTNGGLLWVTEASGTANELNDVFFVGAGRGWATGDLGTILVREDPSTGAAGPFAAGTPGRITASPNPFRSVTDITYEIERPNATSVDLRIYDPAGRLVRRLVASVPSAGRVRTSWDGRDDHGSRLGSGVYFVLLENRGRVERHKITVLR